MGRSEVQLSTADGAVKVLVTGATGFVGVAAVQALLRTGCRVIGVHHRDRLPDGPPEVVWAWSDLTDSQSISALMERHRPSHMLALAWHMTPGKQQALENFRWLQHSIDLIIAFAEAGGRRVTFCGSCAEYDWSWPAKLCEETTPLRPTSEYGAAKAALFTAFGPLCSKLGISGSWARPFFLYGPGENPRRLAADVILSLLAGREALCTHGRQRRDFLHVDDAAGAMVRLLLSHLEGPLNIGSGTAVRLAALIEEAGRQIGEGHLIRLGARAERPGDPPLIEADVRRLHERLGWRPKFDLETGLAHTIAWWRRNIGLDGRHE